MTKQELRDWIDSLSQDIDFEYKGQQGCICPFNRNKIALGFNGYEVLVHSVEAAMTERFIEGSSLDELCDSPDFSI